MGQEGGDGKAEGSQDVPYPAMAIPTSHIAHLGSLGQLYGIETKVPDSCRVIELGCASGRNLLPMAMRYPRSSFVGIDICEGEIERAVRSVEGHSVSNIEYRTGSLVDEPNRGAKYDYVICHGVYSWVSEHDRSQFLPAIRQLLAPGGVALVSFNAKPGWHRRAALREMVLRHVEGIEGGRERVDAARGYLAFLAAFAKGRDPGFELSLRAEIERMNARHVGYVLQDLLSPENEGVSFSEFHDRARAAGLHFVCDTEGRANTESLPIELRKELRGLPREVREQRFDDLVFRSFRSALLCQQGETTREEMDAAAVGRVHIGLPSSLRLIEDTQEKSVFEHVGTEGKMTITDALTRRALDLLRAHTPGTISCTGLADQLKDDLKGSDSQSVRADLFARILRLYYSGLVRFWAGDLLLCDRSWRGPTSLPWARLEGAWGDTVTSAWHDIVLLNGAQLRLLRLADGSRSREELVDVWVAESKGTREEGEQALGSLLKKGLIALP